MSNQASTDPPERLFALLSRAGEALHALPVWAWILAAAILIIWIIARGSRRARTF